MTSEPEPTWSPRRIAVVGVGLLGGSVALAARQRWPQTILVGSSRNEATRRLMVDCGAVHRATDAIDQCVAEADLIVVAAPVGMIAEMLPIVAKCSGPDAIITDVGSTKQTIVQAALADPLAAQKFVGSHPIAGSEKTGVENASASLFQGKLTILTPVAQTDPVRHRRVHHFWQQIGSHVIDMTPDQHDEALAAASHMPHIAASAMAMVLPVSCRALVGSGFRDATRIAAGDPLMWRQIAETNAQATLVQIKRFTDQLERFASAIENGRWDEVQQMFAQAQEAKAAIDDLETRT